MQGVDIATAGSAPSGREAVTVKNSLRAEIGSSILGA